MAETTYSGTDAIPCPSCGRWIRDLSDHDWDGIEDEERTTECGACDREIVLMRRISVTYRATVSESKDSDEKRT